MQQAAATVRPPAPSFILPPVTAATPDPSVATIGGLRYVRSAAPADQPTAEAGAPAPAPSVGGRDASGFMNVFVVGGGINTAPGAETETGGDEQ